MGKLESYWLDESRTIKEAIAAIQNNHSRCIVVLNCHKKVVGVFSEGDVLKAILQGIDIYAPLKKVVKPSFYYLKKKDMLEAYELVKKYGITLIPVIDDNFHLSEIITIFDIMNRSRPSSG